ncbi:MAG: hypothetical protein ACK5LY_11040, partial [Lachnospirales bacterium]
DTSDHMLHMYIPVSENISIDSYKDISNIIKSKQFKFRVEVERHYSCISIVYDKDELDGQHIIAAFSDACLKFGKELDIRI